MCHYKSLRRKEISRALVLALAVVSAGSYSTRLRCRVVGCKMEMVLESLREDEQQSCFQPARNAFIWHFGRSRPTPARWSECPSESSAPRSGVSQHGCAHPPACLRVFDVWLVSKERVLGYFSALRLTELHFRSSVWEPKKAVTVLSALPHWLCSGKWG